MKHPQGPVVLLGASYAKGWNLTVPGVRLINRGVEGQQTFELLARFDADVVAESPRAVILWGFINDIFRAPQGVLDASLARARGSITEIVKRARAAGIEPILATEVTARPRSNTWADTFSGWVGWLRGKESYQDGINRHVLALNQWLRELAQSEGLLLLDLQATVSEPATQRRVREFATSDGSHISPAGYAKLSTYAEPVLRRHLGSQ